MKLILVDDNQQFLEDLKFFTEKKLNHRVIGEAGSGDAFLALKNIGKADVVLMDLIMAETDGFEAAERILRVLPGLKILAMTMNTEKAIRCRLIETGFRGVISKTEMYSTLETILQSIYNGEVAFSELIKKT
jgi:DNA-binding NarL/FixJ family response regulator